MAVNRFMKPQEPDYFQTYVSQYVPQPFELMQRAADNAQKHYDAVAKNVENQQAFLAKLRTHSGADTQALQQYTALYENEFNDIMSSGDLRQQEDRVRQLARQLGEDYRGGPLGKFVQSGNIEMKYLKAAEDAQGKNLGKGGWESSLSGYLGDYHRYWQQHGYGDNFDQAVTTKTDRGSTDITAEVAEAQKLINDETLALIDQPGGKFNEYYRWINGSSEGITDQKATAVIMGTLANNQDVMHDARVRAIMKNKGDMNAAVFEKNMDPDELDQLMMQELAIMANPGITGITFEKRKQSSKFLRDPEEFASGQRRGNKPSNQFGMRFIYNIDSPTGADYASFQEFKDRGADLNVADSFKRAIGALSNTPFDKVDATGWLKKKYAGKKDPWKLFTADLKAGNLEGISPLYQKKLYHDINYNLNMRTQAEARDLQAKEYANIHAGGTATVPTMTTNSDGTVSLRVKSGYGNIHPDGFTNVNIDLKKDRLATGALTVKNKKKYGKEWMPNGTQGTLASDLNLSGEDVNNMIQAIAKPGASFGKWKLKSWGPDANTGAFGTEYMKMYSGRGMGVGSRGMRHTQVEYMMENTETGEIMYINDDAYDGVSSSEGTGMNGPATNTLGSKIIEAGRALGASTNTERWMSEYQDYINRSGATQFEVQGVNHYGDMEVTDLNGNVTKFNGQEMADNFYENISGDNAARLSNLQYYDMDKQDGVTDWKTVREDLDMGDEASTADLHITYPLYSRLPFGGQFRAQITLENKKNGKIKNLQLDMDDFLSTMAVNEKKRAIWKATLALQTSTTVGGDAPIYDNDGDEIGRYNRSGENFTVFHEGKSITGDMESVLPYLLSSF